MTLGISEYTNDRVTTYLSHYDLHRTVPCESAPYGIQLSLAKTSIHLQRTSIFLPFAKFCAVPISIIAIDATYFSKTESNTLQEKARRDCRRWLDTGDENGCPGKINWPHTGHRDLHNTTRRSFIECCKTHNKIYKLLESVDDHRCQTENTCHH